MKFEGRSSQAAEHWRSTEPLDESAVICQEATGFIKRTSVAVLVPAYNEEMNIARLIKQILDEPWTADLVLDEIIIIDDCSEDNTPTVVKNLARDHGHVRMIRNEQRIGKNAGMRAGIAAGHSDVVTFVDADVFLGPGCLTKTIRLLLEDPSLMASSALHAPLPPRSWRERASGFQALLSAELRRLGHGSLSRVYAMRAAVLANLDLPDTLPDDFYIMRWLRDRGYRSAVCADAIAYFRPATGLRDFAKQTVRIWQAGVAMERALPGSAPPSPRLGIVVRGVTHALRREPLGFVLYLAWRALLMATPATWWLPVADHSRYDTVRSTKDLGL
jgi:hypothetical protein